MVAWAPLEREDVLPRLAALRGRSIVKGVRRNTQWEADPEFIRRPPFVDGARALGALGLVCELCVRHEQLAAVPAMARECPDTTIVVDHLGKPDVSGAPPYGWLRAVEDMGRLPNVSCKLSPVVHADSDRHIDAETQAPFLRHVADCLGWERVLFGSNWPVSLAVTGYRNWAQIVSAVLSPSDESRLQALFADNAVSLFGLRPRQSGCCSYG
jgi:L-fuconolactonase